MRSPSAISKGVRERIARLLALQAELERMLRQCAGGAISDCRVIEVLGDHRHCIAETHPRAEATVA